MHLASKLLPSMYFSYNQFMVYDDSLKEIGCDWTAEHCKQGFARRASVVSFGTILEFGHANITIIYSRFQPNDAYRRVIAVPFEVTSGKIIVGGPEEYPATRSFRLDAGHYCLVAAQYVSSQDEEVVDLFFERLEKTMEKSVILVADDDINPELPLIETSHVVRN